MKTIKWIVQLNLFLAVLFLTNAHAEYYVVYTNPCATACAYRSPCGYGGCDDLGYCRHLVPVARSVYDEEEYRWIDP